MQDVMIDLETLGQGPRAVVVSIGACFFDNHKVGNRFYAVVARDQQIKKGREVKDATVNWWMKQSDAARSVFNEPVIETVSSALSRFCDFMYEAPNFACGVRVWGNGATFDNVILASLYEDFGITKPWGYSDDRCYRTLKNLCEPHGTDALPERKGTYHNALDDAVYQAEMAGRYLRGYLKT